jgi:hypothetical protein
MAEIKGPQTILSKALPTGVDGVRIAQWSFRQGRTYQQVVADLALALAAKNTEFTTKWGWLFSIGEDLVLEYEDGGSVTPLQEITDEDDVDSVHGTTIGHMIDLIAYGGAIGGTKRWFRDAREAQFMAQLRTIIRRAEWRFEKNLLTRLFTSTENAVGSGYDVPFVAGGGSVAFTPPAYDGKEFSSSHSHFLGIDSDSKQLDEALNESAQHLFEHGHQGPYIATVAHADIALYRALTDFVQLVDTRVQVVDRGAASSGAQYFANGQMNEMGTFGGFQSEVGYIELRAKQRIPTKYGNLVKSYGQLDSRNPLIVRVHPDEGFGASLVPETTQDDKYPIKKVNLEFEFGIGVGEDRTNGVNYFLDSSGTWSNPTIS